MRTKTQQAQKWLPAENAQAIIEASYQLNILDKDLARREIAYYHQLIQEYFAARVLAEQPEPERLAVPWHKDEVTPSLAETLAGLEVSDPLPQLPTTGWEETTLLSAAMCQNQEQFVRDLMTPNLPLAARCAAAVEVIVSPDLKRQLQDRLIARVDNSQADLRARIVAAEALGNLGDPRFERRTGLHGDYLLPPLATVPAGEYPLGDDDSRYSQEKPAHAVKLAAFEMGIFPLTNAEYRLFIVAGGYEDEQWWQTEAARAWRRGEGSSEGQKQNLRDVYEFLQETSQENIRQASATPEQIDAWLEIKGWSQETLERKLEEWYPGSKIYRQPEYWEDSRFNQLAQPVVGITWFEARAYCAWLSAQTGTQYTLPTEVESEAAARGQAGRVYPWGKEFSLSRCNTFESHIRGTTPVGVFPNGRTPQTKIADLSGNVWEWTTTIWGKTLQTPDFPYPYQADDGREDPEDATVRRVVRGGSWNGTLNAARGACRDDDQPNFRGYGLGCRLVRRSPSP